MSDLWKMAIACEDAAEEMMRAVNDWGGGEVLGRDVSESARLVAKLATEIADEFDRGAKGETA